MIFVAGSGPSSAGHKFAHVVTKKKAHWDYEHIVVPRANWITAETQGKAIAWPHYERAKRWTDYYHSLNPHGSMKYKPSNGLQAVFVAIDKYQPQEITLLGFDYILDEAKRTLHDWPTEKRCIESLVRIIDPRQG